MKKTEYTFHVRLPPILSDTLDRAMASGLTKAEIIRAALIDYLRRNKF